MIEMPKRLEVQGKLLRGKGEGVVAAAMDRESATRIAHRYNAHEGLVAAVRRAKDAIELWGDTESARRHLEFALAAAEGEG